MAAKGPSQVAPTHARLTLARSYINQIPRIAGHCMFLFGRQA